MLPLEGITVVALEQAVAAPFATRQLADLGARVIKIERPEVGDFARGYDAKVNGMASYFVWLNRSKESLTLDLKHPAAQEILHQVLSGADVFIHNLAPGAVERLGFGVDELHRRYPRLIQCSISGYGTSGPYAEKKAYDLLIQCETGLLSVTGTPEAPAKVGISVADISAGMYAYSGILLALYQRAHTGEGVHFEVSLFESLGEWMAQPAYFAAYSGNPPPRTGASHASVAPYGPFRTQDEKTIFLGVQNEREWQAFCERVLEQPELSADERFCTNTRRVTNREALDTTILGAFSRLTAEQITVRLEEARIATARLNSLQEFWEHPQLQARQRWREVDSPVGQMRALLPPITMQNVEPRMDPIPAVGEHTEAILRTLGYSEERIAQLHTEAVI
ncbi:CaiB/BaiF CoA transferase family protein [Ktedonobacter racemifer]|uniref:L-carnitine dehydratase/bile acid-inducible protein F n=1 Tax=Ktedonobacter racemifer DSM 44963 TaxID=485913 RepID=D6TY42_KTERA|nr:CaiB/BaiF CoA-transferase family protein [Ktedonobacter racemifer]EFH85038.1 L-carnitine dehydratase/bile acid-inducible protein F [Ktedonobacter racemifer DSM 44963]